MSVHLVISTVCSRKCEQPRFRLAHGGICRVVAPDVCAELVIPTGRRHVLLKQACIAVKGLEEIRNAVLVHVKAEPTYVTQS